MLQVYHNAKCAKSRECIAFVEASGAPFETVDYLKRPLKFRELKLLLKKLKMNAIDIVCTNEKEWAPFKGIALGDDDIVRILAKHPILIQRPIVVNGDKAVVARPAQKAAEIL